MAFLDFLKSLRTRQSPTYGMRAAWPIGTGEQLERPNAPTDILAGAPTLADARPSFAQRLGGGLSSIGSGLQNYGQEMDQQHQADMAQQQQMYQQAMQRMNMGRTQQNPIMRVGQLPEQAQQAQGRFGDRFAGQRRGGMFSRYRGY